MAGGKKKKPQEVGQPATAAKGSGIPYSAPPAAPKKRRGSSPASSGSPGTGAQAPAPAAPANKAELEEFMAGDQWSEEDMARFRSKFGRKDAAGLCIQKGCRYDRDHEGPCDLTPPDPSDPGPQPPEGRQNIPAFIPKRGKRSGIDDSVAKNIPAASPKKSPQQKRAEKRAEREQWTDEAIAEAFAAAGGTPKAPASAPPPPKPPGPGPNHVPGPGRPSKMDEMDLERIEALARGGATKREIAWSQGICYDTLRRYNKEYSAFSAAIARGRRLRAEDAETSIHRSAAGFVMPEDKVTYDMQTGRWERTTVMKAYPPDVRAQLAILQKAETGSWSPRQEVKVGGKLNHNHAGSLSNLTDQQLEARIAQLVAAAGAGAIAPAPGGEGPAEADA